MWGRSSSYGDVVTADSLVRVVLVRAPSALVPQTEAFLDVPHHAWQQLCTALEDGPQV